MRAKVGSSVGAKLGGSKKPVERSSKPAGQMTRPIDLKSDAEVAAIVSRQVEIDTQAASPDGLPLGSLDGSRVGKPTTSAQFPGKAAPFPVQPRKESVEQGWLRVSGLDANGWLDADEGERRMRLQQAAMVGATKMSAVQRESLLQRIDAYAADATGRPQPVYRGVPVEEGGPLPETMAGPRAMPMVIGVERAVSLAAGQANPYAAPSSGPYVPGGQVDAFAASGMDPKPTIIAGAVTLGALAVVEHMMAKPEAFANPTKKSKSLWLRIKSFFGASPPKKSKRTKSKSK